MSSEILVDTSFLYALYDRKDKYHSQALPFVQQADELFQTPHITLVEAGFLAEHRAGVYGKMVFFQGFRQLPIATVG